MQHAEYGYTTNLPLEIALQEKFHFWRLIMMVNR